MTRRRTAEVTEEEMFTVRVGQKEVQMPKAFRVKDLRKVAEIDKDDTIILHRDGKEKHLKDDDKVDLQKDDFFKNLPPVTKAW
jgi:hypothetical protein